MDETRERLNSAFGGHADVACQLEQAFGPILYIYLSRLDKVAQAVSFVRAEQTGLWHVAADGTERERTAPASAPVFDAQSIVRSRDDLVFDDRSWSYFFDQHAIEPMRLTYERLAADPRSALAEILVALGRNPTSALGVCAATAKMADGLNEEWAQRIMHA